LHGDTKFQRLNKSYLRGMGGYLLVVNVTRPETLDVALELKRVADSIQPGLPALLLLKKSDAAPDTAADIASGVLQEIPSLLTSAKNGSNVETAFSCLGKRMLNL